jgi:hypothetical protein
VRPEPETYCASANAKDARLVSKEGTTGAARLGPAIDAWSEHEVIDDQLATAIEQLEETSFAVGTLEDVMFVDLDHGQSTALRSQGVSCPRRRLFLDEQFGACRLPVGM